MKHKIFDWYGSDGKVVFCQTWQPDNNFDVKAIIALVHGLGEHSGRYKHFAKYFVDRGFGVIASDLRGHGKSAGMRGHVSSYEVLLDQIDRMLEEASKRLAGKFKFIYGHSMGGNLVLGHALTRNPRVAGVVASAPWLRTPEPIPNSKIWQARFMSFLWGWYRENNGLNPQHLARDPNVVRAYVEDELVHSKISARLFWECYNYADYILSHAGTLNVHTLLMHGTEDKMTDHTASQEFTKNTHEYGEYQEWEGFYHELHNEPQKQQVLDFVLNWMQRRLNRLNSLQL